VREVQVTHASCTVIVSRKPGGTWRAASDFRRLNAITKRGVHPLPMPGRYPDGPVWAQLFTSVDMYKGYWQVPMLEADMEKAAFNTPAGLYEWMFMPMGLASASATYQAMMEEILAQFLFKCVVVYLDGVFIYSNS
ncbi:unnamed protein product, partial [Heterosigma akashiwo]